MDTTHAKEEMMNFGNIEITYGATRITLRGDVRRAYDLALLLAVEQHRPIAVHAEDGTLIHLVRPA